MTTFATKTTTTLQTLSSGGGNSDSRSLELVEPLLPPTPATTEEGQSGTTTEATVVVATTAAAATAPPTTAPPTNNERCNNNCRTTNYGRNSNNREDENVIVVQGEAVVATATNNNHNDNDNNGATVSGTMVIQRAGAQQQQQGVAAAAAYYYRDWPFAALFLVQFLAVVGLAVSVGPRAVRSLLFDRDRDSDYLSTTYNNGLLSLLFFQDEDDDKNNLPSSWYDPTDWEGGTRLFGYILAITFCCAVVVTMVAFRILLHYADWMVPIGFLSTPICLFLTAVACWFLERREQRRQDHHHGDENDDNNNKTMIISSNAFLWLAASSAVCMWCLYACYKRWMPYCAANLRTALTAVRAHSPALYLVAFAFAVLTYLWLATWLVAVAAVYYLYYEKTGPCNDEDQREQDDNNECHASPGGLVMFLLFVSLLWTQQVITNLVHMTTAGAVGAWWFSAPPHSQEQQRRAGGGRWRWCCCCCTRDVCDALVRACTYSFGSVCLGSLLVAVAEVLERWIRRARERRRRRCCCFCRLCCGDCLGCVLECLLYYVRAWLQYWTSWGFCYVALYGTDFATSSCNVLLMFERRGWTTIISDYLVFRVVAFCKFAVALTAGALSMLVAYAFIGPHYHDEKDRDDDDSTVPLQWWLWASYVLGVSLGALLSETALFVVTSAVRTVMVCFAEHPAELERHHPGLSEQMIRAWQQAYPRVFTMPEQATTTTTTSTTTTTVTTTTVTTTTQNDGHGIQTPLLPS